MDRYLVISSDCHAGLLPEAYRDYLDPEYREAFDAALPIQIAAMTSAAKRFLVDDINEQWREGRDVGLSGAWDHAARIKVLDSDGIAGEIIFPDGITEQNTPPFGAGLGLPVAKVVPELQWAGARAHNRWLAELVSMAPERHFGVALVPALWDVEEAVREIQWAKKNGLGGILLPVMWGDLDAYHHPKYDPMWSACQELEVVIHFHSGPAPTEDYFGPMTPAADDEAVVRPGGMGVYIAEVPFYLTRPLSFMIWGGVFERFPRLKVAITEGTCIWVPEYLKLHDQRFEVTHYSQKLGDYRSHLSMKPSEYFARNVAIGASCMPRREAELRSEIGIDQIMWGSDYPHPEGSWPETPNQMHATFDGLPEAEIAAMLGGNALRFYGFDEEKLAPLVDRIGPPRSQFTSDARD